MKKLLSLCLCMMMALFAAACCKYDMLALGAIAVARAEAEDERPVEIALLECYPYEKDGKTHTYLALALRAPEESRWSLRTKDGETIDTWINSYSNDSYPDGAEGEKYCILLFNELEGEYAPEDLALSVTYTVPDGAETQELFGDWGACVPAEARSDYGIHDFGGFIGFVEDAYVGGNTDEIRIEVVLQSIRFQGADDSEDFTNAAEQFKFYTKDGVLLTEVWGYNTFEIYNRNAWIYMEIDVQDGEMNAKTGARKIKESLGYIEYIRDDGAVLHIAIRL